MWTGTLLASTHLPARPVLYLYLFLLFNLRPGPTTTRFPGVDVVTIPFNYVFQQQSTGFTPILTSENMTRSCLPMHNIKFTTFSSGVGEYV